MTSNTPSKQAEKDKEKNLGEREKARGQTVKGFMVFMVKCPLVIRGLADPKSKTKEKKKKLLRSFLPGISFPLLADAYQSYHSGIIVNIYFQ